jgi:hypothetical protein
MEKEDSYMLTEMCMMASGKTTKHMAMESIAISMGPSMRANGKTISNTAMVLRLGLMVPSIKGSISKERRRVKDSSPGPMAPLMREHLNRITFKATASTTGLTAESIPAPG